MLEPPAPPGRVVLISLTPGVTTADGSVTEKVLIIWEQSPVGTLEQRGCWLTPA